MYDNGHDDSPAHPFLNRRDIDPHFSEATELYRCEILDRRRPCELNPLAVSLSLTSWLQS